MANNDRPLTEGAKQFAAWLDSGDRSQTGVAKVLGVSQPAVSQWVSGEARPDEARRPFIKKLTGIDADAWETDEEREKRAATDERIRSLCADAPAAEPA